MLLTLWLFRWRDVVDAALFWRDKSSNLSTFRATADASLSVFWWFSLDVCPVIDGFSFDEAAEGDDGDCGWFGVVRLIF